MRRSTWWWLGVALAALATAVVAQPVTQNQLSGNECWSAGQGPGGPSQFLCVNVVRGGTVNFAMTIAGSLTVGTGTGPVGSNGGQLLITAQPAAATLTLPPSPVVDGAIISYCNVTGSPFSTAAVTFAANTNQTLSPAVTLTTQAATSCTKVQWNQASATWYRIQ
jgi:hypothetical protein